MGNIKKITDKDGNVIYPITTDTAVLSEDGKSLNDKYATNTSVDEKIANAQLGGNTTSNKYQTKEDNTLNTTDKTIVGAINEIKENEDVLNVLNEIYPSNNKTLYLNNLVEDTDISDAVNEALNTEGVSRVVLPLGRYYVSKTIEVPIRKTLKLQGSYYSDVSNNDLDDIAKTKNTILYLKSPNISMIKLRRGAILEGGFLYLGTYENVQAIRLNFWEEPHPSTSVFGTRIKGTSTRDKNQVAVLMECDPDDGVTKNGYGVYCTFDISIAYVSIGYHLHRHNSTWQQDAESVVWMTECYFKGHMRHCNRYIWFDTEGGWAGDSSVIEAVIQGGTVVGEDTPGIELDCGAVRILGSIWDFGMTGLQQCAIKFNPHSKKNFVLGLSDRASIIDLGTNNRVYTDIIKKVDVNDIVSPKINSFIGNEERFTYAITINYANGNQVIIDDIYGSKYDFVNAGHYINGVKYLECLFEQYKNTNLREQYFTTINYEGINSIEIEFVFTNLVAIYDVGITVSEVCVPNNITIEIEKLDGTIINCLDKTFLETDTEYTNSGVIICHEDLLQKCKEGKYGGITPKSYIAKKLRYKISGYVASSRNYAKTIKIRELMANIEGIRPNFNDRYLYDFNNLNVKDLNGNALFGAEKLNIDFSNYSNSPSLDEIFNNSDGFFTLEVVGGQLNIKCNSYDKSLTLKDAYSGISIIEYEYKVNSTEKISFMNNNKAHSQISGKKIFISNKGDNPTIVLRTGATLGSDEYVKINRIIIYENTNKRLYWPEIIDKFTNYYI